MIYILIMNVIGFCLMGLDKHLARTRQWRVPEKILFGAALLGGSAGAWAGMYVFHHKTRHWYFVVGIPLILAAQLALAVYFTALFYGHKKSAALLTPPDGMRETDIALESSTCTGETVIGFRSKADGHLLNAVVVRSRADIETFYKSYGFVYTGKFDK